MLLDVRDRDVLLLDDIFDTGKTLKQIAEHMKRLGAKSLRTAVLLRKSGTQLVEFEPDYVAFSIPDEFVVGYGLDYEDQYRNLPYVASMEDHDLKAHRSILTKRILVAAPRCGHGAMMDRFESCIGQSLWCDKDTGSRW